MIVVTVVTNVTVVTVVTVVTKKLFFSPKNFFHQHFFSPNFFSQRKMQKKINCDENSKTQIEVKNKNSIVMKLKNTNWDETQKLKW